MLSVSYDGISSWDADAPATLVWGDSNTSSGRFQEANEPAHVGWRSEHTLREDILQPQHAAQDPVPGPALASTHLIWCDELYRREERQDTEDTITAFANQNGFTVLRFRKAYHYSAWLSHAESGQVPPHILLTDWREFKPCNIFLETEREENFPMLTILFLSGAAKATRAANKAVREAKRQHASRKFLIVHNERELLRELARTCSNEAPVPSEEVLDLRPAFIEPSVPYPRFLERPTSWQF
mmetsp:Transcript_81941/g.171461  ORF Transcript_81941/g.171461 Transcript_81941/m.171461 type:complete len:241 (-) Transcript_81941:167-889(-)